MTLSQPAIGEGIYTAADAARILKMPYSKAKYWFNYYVKSRLGDNKHQYYFTVNDIIAVNFLTLIEMVVFYKLKERGVSSKTIRKAHSVMAEKLNTPYPFANKAVFSLGKNGLYFEHLGNLLSSSDGLQTAFEQVVIPFSEKIEFSKEGVAAKYYPLGKKSTIVVNPKHQFGQPVIEGTNILTETILMLYRGKEPIASICELYGVSRKNVKDAIAFSRAA